MTIFSKAASISSIRSKRLRVNERSNQRCSVSTTGQCVYLAGSAGEIRVEPTDGSLSLKKTAQTL